MKQKTKKMIGISLLSSLYLLLAAGSGSSALNDTSSNTTTTTKKRATYDYDTQSVLDDIKKDVDYDVESILEDNTDDGAQQVENGDYSLVSPDFKELMDSYEAFYDSYISFMKKYSSNTDTDALTMLQDYNDMLQKEMEWSEKIDKIDVDSLSAADSAYYLLVTTRVEKKLLESMMYF